MWSAASLDTNVRHSGAHQTLPSSAELSHSVRKWSYIALDSGGILFTSFFIIFERKHEWINRSCSDFVTEDLQHCYSYFLSQLMVSFVVAAVHYLFHKVSPVPLYNIYLPKSDNQIKDKIFNSLFNFCQLAITEMSPCHIDTENESCLEPYQENTILQMLQQNLIYCHDIQQKFLHAWYQLSW